VVRRAAEHPVRFRSGDGQSWDFLPCLAGLMVLSRSARAGQPQVWGSERLAPRCPRAAINSIRVSPRGSANVGGFQCLRDSRLVSMFAGGNSQPMIFAVVAPHRCMASTLEGQPVNRFREAFQRPAVPRANRQSGRMEKTATGKRPYAIALADVRRMALGPVRELALAGRCIASQFCYYHAYAARHLTNRMR
jgi:hypothetical protein